MTDNINILSVLESMSFALICTCVIEALVMLMTERRRIFILFNFWCNVITNPLLNAVCLGVYYTGGRTAYYICVAVGEICVLLGEMKLYELFDRRQEPRSRYFYLSLITNAASYLSGIVINHIIK